MFNGIESTVSDLLLFDRRNGDIPLRVALPQPAVARAILQIAGGKIPEHLGRPIVDALHADEIAAARHFVAGQFLAPGADHFRTLGLPHDADASAIRDHFRRLMGLVHPDSNPVGYPDDAAIRVNRAYAVLSSDDSRTQYLSSLSSPASDSVALVPPAVRPRMDGHGVGRQRSVAPTASIWRSWSDKLRARHNLLLLASILLLPAIWFAFSNLRSAPPVRLVEAKRGIVTATAGTEKPPASAPAEARADPSPAVKLAVNPEAAASPVADSPQSPEGSPPLPSTTPPATMTRSASAVAASPTTAERNRAVAAASKCRNGCANALAPELSPRSMGLVAAKLSPSLAPLSPSSAVEASTLPATAAAGARASAGSNGQTVSPTSARDSARTAPANAAPTSTAAVPSQTGRAPDAKSVESPASGRPSEIEDLLVRFSSAYESGSIPAFSQLFAASMAGRRQLLNEYERVFVSTRSRAIKFGQLKQSAVGDRMSLAGYATVTTVDTDNRARTQRVFLEFEIGRERGEPRIERLANYAMN